MGLRLKNSVPHRSAQLGWKSPLCNRYKTPLAITQQSRSQSVVTKCLVYEVQVDSHFRELVAASTNVMLMDEELRHAYNSELIPVVRLH